MVAKLAESIVDTLEKEKIITAQLREHYICLHNIDRKNCNNIVSTVYKHRNGKYSKDYISAC